MQGLITKGRKNLDPAAAPFARNPGDIEGLKEGASLLEVVSPMSKIFTARLRFKILYK